jgi:hypothetical protein
MRHPVALCREEELRRTLLRAADKFDEWSRLIRAHGGMGQIADELTKDAEAFRAVAKETQ